MTIQVCGTILCGGGTVLCDGQRRPPGQRRRVLEDKCLQHGLVIGRDTMRDPAARDETL